MLRIAKYFAAAIALGSLLSMASVTTASASPVAAAAATAAVVKAKPDLHYAGANCKTIHSQQNWTATICVMTNADDMRADQLDQALVTYTIKAGGLAEVTVKTIYLHACEGYCYNQNPRSNVRTRASGRSAYISNNFAFDPDDTVQAVAVDPCVYWSNGQSACWPGTHEDETISTD
jgi:hypothetical protein